MLDKEEDKENAGKESVRVQKRNERPVVAVGVHRQPLKDVSEGNAEEKGRNETAYNNRPVPVLLPVSLDPNPLNSSATPLKMSEKRISKRAV